MNLRASVQALCVFIALVSVVRAYDDSIQAKLNMAKATYETYVEKFRADVAASLEKREESARKVGDKKAVDQIKAERGVLLLELIRQLLEGGHAIRSHQQ